MSVGIAVLAVAASQSVAADGQAVLSHTQRRVQAGVVAQPGFETNRGQFDSADRCRLGSGEVRRDVRSDRTCYLVD
jgi:hypothetical protein